MPFGIELPDWRQILQGELRKMTLRGFARQLVRAKDVRERYLHVPERAVQFMADQAGVTVAQWRACEKVLQDAFLGDIKVP